MRLSEEIMDGSFYLQHKNYFGDGVNTGCALQLGQRGRNAEHCQILFPVTGDVHPWTNKIATCPHCGHKDSIVCIIAFHLNDTHEWNLSRIVDWVRSVEPDEAADTDNLLQPTQTESRPVQDDVAEYVGQSLRA